MAAWQRGSEAAEAENIREYIGVIRGYTRGAYIGVILGVVAMLPQSK